ncbi:MAG: phage tail tape measure protein [Carnobacterium sp.]|uniref:phage tail tape measure protein n=1 Tax=Carnobacterium sp. TaxID=48221 RepID=UPI003315DBFB
MAEDFRFGIDVEATVSNKEEAILALQQLKREMEEVSQGVKIDVSEEDINKAKIQIQALEKTIDELGTSGGDFKAAFSKNLESVQSDFKDTAKEAKRTTKEIEDLNRAAQNGGFSNISKTAKIATRDIQGTSSQIDSLKQNLQQGVGQTLAFGAITGIQNALSSAIDNATELDEIMTDISIVSGKTNDEMQKYRDYAGEAADALGTMGSDYLEASLIYEQQGGVAAYYAKDLADATVTAANISRESTAQMSEYLTATINGFDLLSERGGQAATYITDVLAKLGAASGSDLAEIATGLTRTANTARDVGFEFEEISTMIATVSEVTRRTPETIGNAFKSMLTTFTQLREAGGDELEEFTNKVEEAFKLGGIEDISVFDNGQLREASDIFKDIADRWDTMNMEQQSLVSESVAGKYQAETFRAFMNNQERYNELLDEAYGAAGTSAQQQLIYMDSLEAKTKQFGNQWEIISTNIIDSDMFKGLIDDATNLLKIVGAQEKGFQTLATALAPVVGIFGQLFGSRFVGEAVQNKQLNDITKNTLKNVQEIGVAEGKNTQELERQVKAASEINKIMNNLGQEAGGNFRELVQEIDLLNEKIRAADLAPEQFEKEVQTKAREALGRGGTKGIQNAKFTEELEQEQGRLYAANETLQATEQTLQIEAKRLALAEQALNAKQGEKNTISSLNASLLDTTNQQNLLDNLTDETAAQVKVILRDVNEWGEVLKETGLDSKFIDQVNKEIAKSQKQIVQLTDQDLQKKRDAVKAKGEELRLAYEQQKVQASENVVRRNITAAPGSIEEMKQTVALGEKTLEGYRNASAKTELATKATQGLSLAYSTLVPILATVNAVQKDQISVQDGVISSLQSVGSMLMFAPGLWAKAAGGITLALSMIVDHMDIFSDKAEIAKEKNDELIRSYMSMSESTNAQLKNLEGLQEVYTQFQGIDAASFLASDDVDTESLEEYLNMAEKIAEVRPDLVKYYNEEGQAIIDLTQNYEDLVEAQRKVVDDTAGILANNREGFMTQYSADIEDSQLGLIELNKQMVEAQKNLKESQAKNDEKGITSSLSEITDLNNKISEYQKTITDSKELINTNIIQPFYQSNTQLRKINEELGISTDKIKEFSSSIVDSDSLTKMISNGDSGSAEAAMTNLEMIYDKYYEIAKLQGEEKADKFLGKIADSSSFAKSAIYELQNSIEDLGRSMDEKGDVTGWLEGITLSNISSFTQVSKDVQEQINDTTDKIIELEAEGTKIKKQGGIIGFLKNNLPSEMGMLNSEIEVYNRELEKLRGNLDEDYSNNLEEVAKDFEKASQTADGYKQALEEIGKQEQSIDAIKDILKDGVSDSALKQLSQFAPEIAKGIESGTVSAKDSLRSLQDVQTSAITGMMMNNEAYYEDWKVRNASQIQLAEESLGIQLGSASTLAEAKIMLEQATTSQLRVLAAQRVSDNQVADEAVVQGAQKTYANLTTLNGIWSDGTLTVWQKLNVSILEIFDGIMNAFKGLVAEALDYLNGFLDKIPGPVKDVLAFVFPEISTSLNAIDAAGEKFTENSSTYADKYIKNIQEEQRKEQEERESLIQQILEDRGTGDNTDLFKDNFGKYVTAGLGATGFTKDEDEGDGGGDTGGGGGDKEDEDEVENLRLTLNQYYKLENALKKIQDQYDALGKKKDAAYGEDKLRLMTQEQEMLVKQTNLLKQHSAALSQEQADIKKHLSGYGFTFDKQGEVRNLNERLTALQNEANKKTGVAKEAAIAAVQSLQEEASRYSEITFDLIPDKKKAIEEAKQTFSQIAREKVEYAVQIKVDRYSMQREVLDVVKEMQDTFGTLDEKMDYTARQARTSLNEIALLQKAMDEVRKNPALTDSDREELLQQYQKDLLAAVGDARSAYKEMAEIQQDFISQTIDQIDEVTDGYDRIIDKSQTMIDKLKDLYGNKNFGQIEKLYDTQNKALEAQLKHLQNSQRALIKYRDTLEKGTDAWKDANDQIIEMGEAIDNNLVAKIDLLKAKFEDFSNSVFDKFNNLFGVWGLDGAVDDFDKLIDKSNEFMSTYDKITVIGNKIKSINEEIAKTNDPTRAAELAKYRDEELVSLLEQDQVSQSEYERALKLYEIKQKELALQDRQNASRIAQLVRDENGNMSYEYVRQETDDTQKALDELNEAKNDLYEFDSKKVQEASKKIFEIIQNYQAKLKELESKGLSPEDYKKELDKLLAGTQAEIDAQQAIVDKWMQNVGKDGFKNIMDMFGQGSISADQLGVSQKLMEQVFGALQDGSLTYQDILSGNYDKFAGSIGASAEEVKKAMDGIMEVVLGDNKTITDALTDASNKWSSTAKDNVSQLGEAYKKYMTEANKVLNQYNTTTGTLNNLLNQTNQSSKNVTQSIKNQTDAMVKTKKASDNTSTSVKNLEKMLIGSGNGGLFGSFVKVKNEQNNKLQPSIKTTTKLTSSLSSTVNTTAGKYKYMGERAEEARQRVIAYSDKKTKQGVKDVESAGNVAKNNAAKYDTWRKNIDKTKSSTEDLIKSLSKLPGMENFLGQATGVAGATAGNKVGKASKGASFDTGGYTGTWDNSTNNSTGRMAILHEKELVLNKYDTSNLLEAVKLQRNLTEKLQNAKLSAASTINKVNETVNNNRIDNSNITQPITIHADFPNANSSSEIEAAFQGLFGKASTFIGKK